MYKNQLQELAQRSCFNLPSYACIREGPDHAPRFKATVNFNGEIFESPTFFSTLRQAEHAAAEVALSTLAKRGPSKTLAAKVLDETGVYKNLLQETAHRAGLNLPVYTTVRSGPGHVPVFSCTVELAGMTFTGDPTKTKKQAQKNAAMAAWSSLKQMSHCGSSSPASSSSGSHEEQDQVVVARFLASLNPAESSNSQQSNLHKGHRRTSTTSRTSSSSTASSFNPRYPNWASSNLSPEMAIYHMWMQEQAAEQQRRLMALPLGIPPVPPPSHVFPWMHSMLQLSHHPYCLTEQQPHSVSPGVAISTTANSSFHFPSQTMMTIQEIHEEKPGDPSRHFPAEATAAAVLADEKHQKEDKQDSFPSTGNIASAHPEPRENGPLEWATTKSRLQSPLGLLSSPPNMRPNHAQVAFPLAPQPAHPRSTQKSFRIPVNAPRMQSGGASFSAGPRPGRMQVGGSHSPFMAPAVQIRSVVPVCSAAPPRRTMGSAQERPPSNGNGTPTDISIMSSKLGNLHI